MKLVTTATERTSSGIRDARMSGLLLIALGVALAGLHSILADVGWWFSAFAVMVVVLGSSSLSRYFLRPRWLPSVIGVVLGIAALTLGFGGGTGVFGLVPTPGTVRHFESLITVANGSIASQGIPAVAVDGIQFLICATIAGIAVIMDLVAITWRVPALTGIPLLIVLAVPSVVQASLADPVFFELTAVAYLFVIRARLRRVQPAVALVVGAVAVLGALIVPVVLPPVSTAVDAGTGIGGLAENINPIISLGDNLRRTIPAPALTYTTTEGSGVYLRLTTLENFVGRQWSPVVPKPIKGNTVSAIAAPPGLTSAVKRSKVSTNIQVANSTSQWLPVPYPSKSITGLTGDWFWEPKALAVLSDDSNMEGQKYTVKSLDVEPSQQQLESAPRSPTSPLAAVPKGLDPIVAETAKKVVGSAATDFDKALALQDWFRGGTFKYSVHTPALSGFDGSGLDVIVPFLNTKSGYCIHFATTMAVMARTLGIPSRIAVGFLPGTATHAQGAGPTVFRVSSNDLHAWPELYFSGVGWVRFEPTPSRGFEPTFPDAPSDQALPDPSAAPAVGATATPTPGLNNQSRLPDESAQKNSGALDDTSTPTANWGLLGLLALLVLVFTPAFARTRIRRGRVEAVRDGANAASVAWQELRESARDLGLDARSSATPRELCEYLRVYLLEHLTRDQSLSDESVAALDRLRSMVEDEAFAFSTPAYTGERMADALMIVLRGLRRASSNGARFRAMYLPSTLVDRALGRSTVRA
jgi:transglutaminase-like putative cysteine protease